MTPRKRRLLLAGLAVAMMAGEAVWLLKPPPPPPVPDFVIAPTGLVAVLEPDDIAEMPAFDPKAGRWVDGGEVLISPRSRAWLGHAAGAVGPKGRYAYVVARLPHQADAQMLHHALADIAAANVCHAGIFDPGGKLHDGKPEVFLYRIVSTRAPDGRVVACHERFDGLREPETRWLKVPGKSITAAQKRETASSPSR
ncbi:hypothetical protein [Novosphingobium sp. 9]|uniref:hypothetical protein n=1 Tax=Novosphingobium sp. 9 TaxID=2025349 RepID=UPI0021B5A639|nr:hypothetical protein [Novosphingobium sp. 9]